MRRDINFNRTVTTIRQMLSGCRWSRFAWEKPHFRFHSSLFTDSPETPINTGVVRGEECLFTLHHSSPYCKVRPSLMTGTSHNRWLVLVIIDDRTIVYIMRFLKKMMKVKSGEEWWRVSSTFHRHKYLIHKSLHYECEEWRVFLKVAFYASDACKWLKKRDLWAVGQFVRTNSICPCYFFLCLLTLCFPLRNS